MPEVIPEYQERSNQRLIDDDEYWEQVVIGYCGDAHSSDFGTDIQEIELYKIPEPYKSVIREALREHFKKNPIKQY